MVAAAVLPAPVVPGGTQPMALGRHWRMAQMEGLALEAAVPLLRMVEVAELVSCCCQWKEVLVVAVQPSLQLMHLDSQEAMGPVEMQMVAHGAVEEPAQLSQTPGGGEGGPAVWLGAHLHGWFERRPGPPRHSAPPCRRPPTGWK